MTELILRNVIVVTADAERRVIRDGAVAVAGGKIARVGSAACLSQAGRPADADAVFGDFEGIADILERHFAER
jgi:cytosine/adenosine deaminase-related metal-dependent hydrolase